MPIKLTKKQKKKYNVDRAPRMALIGRPNVGKSTLFNILTRTRKALVKDQSGVTRDVQVEPAEWWGHKFDVVDTGGITEARDIFSTLIREHITDVLRSVDIIVAIMDGKTGLMPEDRDIIKLVKESGKPVFLVVNKVDQGHNADVLISEFYEFGLDVHPCSFERQDGVDVIVEWAIDKLPKSENTDREGIRLAIIGKPNVGKSSLCNYLIGENRMLVSDVAGTTVDAIEAQFKYNEENYVIVDTAGLRRQSKREDGVEYVSAVMSQNAIGRADMVFLMIDGHDGPSVQDAKMLQIILSKHKAVILVVNKTDSAVKDIPAFRSTIKAKIEKKFHFFKDIPVQFVSAKTGSGMKDLFERAEDIWGKMNLKIKTSKLNNFFFESIRGAPSPVYGSKNVKFYYLVQTNQKPPSFIAFANHPEGVTPAYRRFLIRKVKEEFDLHGIPIRIFCMKSRNSATRKTVEVKQDHVALDENATPEEVQAFEHEATLALKGLDLEKDYFSDQGFDL